MGKTKRKFIDKKNAITFRLVHRSQRDPLIADEDAPQLVLVEHRKKDGTDAKRRRKQQIDCGIYFNDDYDYMQHIKDVDEPSSSSAEWVQVERIQSTASDTKRRSNVDSSEKSKSNRFGLPEDVFPSSKEEDEGMLAKGLLPVGPRPDWDPDLVAALDDDFDYDDPNNQLDDDFIFQAGGALQTSDDSKHVKKEVEEDDDDEYEDIDDDDEDDDTLVSDDLNEYSDQDDQDDNKTCFTNYSLTSSVMRRSEGLHNLDDKFEALYEREYADDTELGPLDTHTIEPLTITDPNLDARVRKYAADYRRDKRLKLKDVVKWGRDPDEKLRPVSVVDDDEETETITIERSLPAAFADEDALDCESILSTYSNIYNHPALIVEPKKEANNNKNKIELDARTGMPRDAGHDLQRGLTAQKLAQLDAHNNERLANERNARSLASESRYSELSTRPPSETAEERRVRKAALREYRRERRAEKKATKVAFTAEKVQLEKQVVNVQNKLKSVKLV